MKTDTEWIEIGKVDDIPLLGTRTIKSSKGNIALFRTASSKVFAVSDKCPHKGGPLSQGIVHGEIVTCPMHNRKICLVTGKELGMGKGIVALWRVRIKGGIIFLGPQKME